MILLRNLRYKNFLSTGNQFTEIELNKHQTVLISGKNGSGKSTLMDALCFVLFNKPFRKVNKPQLVNSVNKNNLLVEVEFSTNNNNYLIRRGIKPNIFEIYKDGTLVNEDSNSRDFQKYLEENVLKINYKSFIQICILGNANFKPFMDLTAPERRLIIEDLLDIKLFSVMNTCLKEKISENKDDLFEVNKKIEILGNTIELKQKHKKERATDTKKTINKKTEEISSYTQKINSTVQEIEEKNNQIKELGYDEKEKTDLEKKLLKLQRAQDKSKKSIDRFKKEIEFYSEKDNCPTCKQKIDEEFKNSIIEEKHQSISEEKDTIVKLSSLESKVSKKIKKMLKLEDEIENINSSIQENLASINFCKSMISSLNNEIEELQEKTFDENIFEIEELEEANHEKENIIKTKELYSVASILLKDSGIKSQIIKQYLPVMNNLINSFLEKMNFHCEFFIDEAFKETIKTKNRDEFSFNSFSEGEKMRINLAILFTWRELSKLRNACSFNLLILDEIMDSSLDAAGTDEFIDIINTLTGDQNTIIISHKHDQIAEKFDHNLHFKKIKGFSGYARV
jgi:DNA repair exonuclease SbcCD ATPase subunit